MESITSTLSALTSGKLGHALLGLLILIIGLFVVKVLAKIIKKLLHRVGILKKHHLVSPVHGLIKAAMTLFVLMAVLQHFGLTGVLDPLKEMVEKFFSAIPNVIGAGVIAYAGWIIAKIVSQLVGSGLQTVDYKVLAKTGNENLKLSKLGSSVTFAVILLPITVAALGVLNIPAISEPASNMIQKLMAAIPNIIGAAIILGVTYFVVKFVTSILTGILEGLNVDSLPQKMGAQSLFSSTFTPTKLITSTIMFFAMLTAATAAVNTLGINVVSTIFAKILEFGGGILVGGLILLIGNFLSSLAYNKLSSTGNMGLANIARLAILGLVLAMGLRAMGLADNIVNMAFGFTIGAVAIAAALAFGFGGRDAAKTLADRWVSRMK